jgi:hypothetical protein
MKKIFSAGSCRLLSSIEYGNNLCIPIHSINRTGLFTEGINFLGKLHNSKQHIQFINYILGTKFIPPKNLSLFLTSYNTKYAHISDPISTIPYKQKKLREEFNNCEVYLIEICSLKIYEVGGYQCQVEHLEDLGEYPDTKNIPYILQDDADLYTDLIIIRSLIPSNKKIVFQCHFRPNIIFKDDALRIENREIIYNALKLFCEANANTFLYDPSVILEKDITLFDGYTHFTEKGYEESFKYIYENFIK